MYEYNREPGTVTRATLHPILQSRVGPDVFANRILRLREDVRFKNVGPESLEMADEETAAAEDGVWFDWAFVEFLKNNYCEPSCSSIYVLWNGKLRVRLKCTSVCTTVDTVGSRNV